MRIWFSVELCFGHLRAGQGWEQQEMKISGEKQLSLNSLGESVSPVTGTPVPVQAAQTTLTSSKMPFVP